MPLPAADELRRFRDTTRPLLRPARSPPRISAPLADGPHRSGSFVTRADRFAGPSSPHRSIALVAPFVITRTHTTDALMRNSGRGRLLCAVLLRPAPSSTRTGCACKPLRYELRRIPGPAVKLAPPPPALSGTLRSAHLRRDYSRCSMSWKDRPTRGQNLVRGLSNR